MLWSYIKFALGTFTHRKTRSVLTMIGIFIGIAAVISLIGLGEGLRTAISSQFGFLGPDVLSVQASGLTFAGPPGTAIQSPQTEQRKTAESVLEILQIIILLSIQFPQIVLQQKRCQRLRQTPFILNSRQAPLRTTTQ